METEFKVFTSEDGTDIYYLDAGEGMPFIFVPGFGASTEQVIPVIDVLKSKFRCICFDQRGNGRTKGSGEVSIHQSARDMEALLENLGIEKAVLLGSSMGGSVCYSYMKQFGCGRADRMIIMDQTPKTINEGDWKLGLYQGWYTRGLYEEDLRRMKEDYDLFALRLTEQAVKKWNPEDPRDFSRSKEEMMESIMKETGMVKSTIMNFLLGLPEEKQRTNYYYWKSMAESDFRDSLKDITAPTAIIYADPGSVYCPATFEYLASQIPNATLIPIMGSTHNSMGEDIDDFVRIVSGICKVTK